MATTEIRVSIEDGAISTYVIFDPAPAVDNVFSWKGPIYLVEDEYIKVRGVNCAIGKYVYLHVMAHYMRVP